MLATALARIAELEPENENNRTTRRHREAELTVDEEMAEGVEELARVFQGCSADESEATGTEQALADEVTQILQAGTAEQMLRAAIAEAHAEEIMANDLLTPASSALPEEKPEDEVDWEIYSLE